MCSAVRPIIWGVLALALACQAAGCDLNPPEPSGQPPPHLVTSPEPSGPSPSPQTLAVWALWPLGVNVHTSPSTAATVAGTADQGTVLDVNASRTVDGKPWLEVTAGDQSGLKGWVLDDPGLVIHQDVSLHIDSEQAWSMLYPSGWTLEPASNPTGVTTVTGDGLTMTVDVETPTPAFTAPGADLRDQQIEVYGKTTVLSAYQLAAGGVELVTRLKWDASRYFTITYREPQPDTALFLQLVTSIKID